MSFVPSDLAASTSVLVVEDEILSQRELARTLRELGYGFVDTASSGEEALARAALRSPDVVLMDIRIKGPRDGIAVGRQLRSEFGAALVYLTSHSDPETVARAAETMPHGYLTKPVNFPSLGSTLEIAVLRNRVELGLRARDRWLATTLASIADAVVAVDLDGRVTFMNGVAEKLTGVCLDDARGRLGADVVSLDDLAQGQAHPLRSALDERRAQRVGTARLRNPTTGRDIPISDSAAPVFDEGKLLGAVMVFRDMTADYEQQRRFELTDRLSSLGTLAAGVAHEINNPLAALLGNLGLLRETSHEATHREMLDDCLESTEAIATIVRDLSTFGRTRLEEATGSSVATAVSWAVRISAVQTRHRATVRVDVPPSLCVMLAESRLGQIVLNLVLNAAHAFEVGDAAGNHILIQASERGETVTVLVEDDGPGMPANVRARAFDPFFTTKQVGHGSGLGLAICHGIVTAAGGTIALESEEGSGTRVSVTLPRQRAEPVTHTPPSPSGRSRHRCTSS